MAGGEDYITESKEGALDVVHLSTEEELDFSKGPLFFRHVDLIIYAAETPSDFFKSTSESYMALHSASVEYVVSTLITEMGQWLSGLLQG